VDGGNYLSGSSVTVLGNTGTLVKTGFSFTGWDTVANGGGTVLGATFTMGSANVMLYAQWSALPTFTVTYYGNDSTSGTVPQDGNLYLSGASVIVRSNSGILAKTGCAFAGWNTNANATGTSYSPGDAFTITGNVTLYAHWLVSVTATAGPNGSISPSGSSTVTAGSNVSFTITPATNYHVSNVTDNGSSVGAVTSYAINSDTVPHTVVATFAINTFTITSTAGLNGTIAPLGSTPVAYGDSLQFTITPSSGYQVDSVSVDGVSVGAPTSYTIQNIAAPHTIDAEFK
jgi:uncharacterized repeat protein (TIGR02543 family)